MLMLRFLAFSSIVAVCKGRNLPKFLLDRSPTPILRQRDDAAQPNPNDLDWVASYAALGDSYSAGIGVGDVIDSACSRYDGAYESTVSEYLFIEDETKIQNIACTGATSQEILEKQVNQLADGSLDLVTLTAGGNDVGFSSIMSTCVYLTTTQEACDTAITNAENAIPEMSNNVAALLQGLTPKLTQQGFIVYAPYAKFWNEEPNYCDGITWAYWDPLGIVGGLKLTSDNRKRMNKLTDDVNNAIRQVITASTSPVHIAEWDGIVQSVQGTFCSDIAATDPAAGDDILMFIRQNVSPYPSAASMPQRQMRYGKRQDGLIAPSNSTYLNTSATGVNSLDAATGQSANEASLLPDALVMPFHPSGQGQETIAGAIYASIVRGRAEYLNIDPAHPPSACTADPSLPTGSHTPGNPVNPVNPLQCFAGDSASWKPTGTWANQPAAVSAAELYCASGVPNYNLPDSELEIGRYSHTVTYWQGSANELDLSIQFFENKVLSVDECNANFVSLINNCDPKGPNNPYDFKYGGTYDVDGGSQGGMIFKFQPRSNKVGQNQLFCDDVGDQTFMNPTVMDQSSESFCAFITDPANNAGSLPAQTYNQGTPDEVVYKANWPDTGFPPSADDCRDAYGQLNNGCQLPSGDSNPSNFKHGGHFVLNTDVIFSVQPSRNNSIRDGTNFGWTSFKQTHYGNTGQGGRLIDKPTLQNCLRTFGNRDWQDNVDCNGMVTFYMDRWDGWNSPSDCFNGCKNQVSEQIDYGASATNCDAYSGFTKCWLGYRVQ